MDAGLAAIIGAGVGAVSSIGAVAVGALPGFSAEDRAARLSAQARRNELVLAADETFLGLAIRNGPLTPAGKSVEVVKLQRLRTQLSMSLDRRQRHFMPFFSACFRGARSDDQEVRASAHGTFGAVAPEYLRGGGETEAFTSVEAEARTKDRGLRASESA